ncbi:MAG: hypothetical protein ACYDDA_00310 [Acidiferrobacteraceae bacterium]
MNATKEITETLQNLQVTETVKMALKEHQAIFNRMKEEGVIKQRGYTVVGPIGISRKQAVSAKVFGF